MPERKKKKDLKMRKFQSPCNCRIKGRKGSKKCGRSCSKESFLQPVEVVERVIDDGSDSEEVIAYSNRRILSNAEGKPRYCSKEVEVDKTIHIGSLIGFELGGLQPEVMAALNEVGAQRSNG